jgi:hypothetical protein
VGKLEVEGEPVGADPFAAPRAADLRLQMFGDPPRRSQRSAETVMQPVDVELEIAVPPLRAQRRETAQTTTPWHFYATSTDNLFALTPAS